jgi:hypothetical protein
MAIHWFPVLAGVGLVTSLAILTQFDVKAVVAGLITVALGFASYLVMKKSDLT